MGKGGGRSGRRGNGRRDWHGGDWEGGDGDESHYSGDDADDGDDDPNDEFDEAARKFVDALPDKTNGSQWIAPGRYPSPKPEHQEATMVALHAAAVQHAPVLLVLRIDEVKEWDRLDLSVKRAIEADFRGMVMLEANGHGHGAEYGDGRLCFTLEGVLNCPEGEREVKMHLDFLVDGKLAWAGPIKYLKRRS